MMETLTSLDPLQLYPALFVGLILLGGFVLLPAMYLALMGSINLLFLFFATVIAGMVSDSFWYAIGLSSKKEKLYSLPFIRKRVEEAKRFSSFYQKHGVRLVFLTKFVYGTRVASHVLAGMHKINLFKFILATGAGTSLWFWIFYFLVKALDLGITSAKATAFRIQILFLVTITILVLFNWITGKYLRKKLLRRGD